MKKLTTSDLMSLEQYAKCREDFRQKAMAHKKNRRVALGDHITFHFEDSLIIQYQIQEILRVEKIFEANSIQEELDTYNPLIPDGKNWKATMMIEYVDVKQRKEALQQLIGINEQVWIQVGDEEKVYPISDEDLERETEDKTSAVHFLRFELTIQMIDKAKSMCPIYIGSNHKNYLMHRELSRNHVLSLLNDLE